MPTTRSSSGSITPSASMPNYSGVGSLDSSSTEASASPYVQPPCNDNEFVGDAACHCPYKHFEDCQDGVLGTIIETTADVAMLSLYALVLMETTVS